MEHSYFTPLVLSTTRGMCRAAIAFYRRLAAMLSKKSASPTVKLWVGYAAIRGARYSATKPAPALHMPVDFQTAEGQLHV